MSLSGHYLSKYNHLQKYFIDYNWHLSTVKITFLLLKCLLNSKPGKVNILQCFLCWKIEQYNKIVKTVQSLTYPLYIGILMMLQKFSYRKRYIVTQRNS